MDKMAVDQTLTISAGEFVARCLALFDQPAIVMDTCSAIGLCGDHRLLSSTPWPRGAPRQR